MNKYTVIYSTYQTTGTHTSCVTCYRYIEGNDILDALEKADIEWEDVWFVFDGHSIQADNEMS